MAKAQATEKDQSEERPEDITGEMSERIRLLLSPVEESDGSESLAATPDELEKICSLDIPEHEIQKQASDLEGMYRMEPDRFRALIGTLMNRNFDTVIPIQEESFAYRRYIQECNRLRKSILQSKSVMEKKAKEDRTGAEDESEVMLADIAKLLVLQSRAADWLEESYFPALYERTTNSAKGEVMQYLIKQKNTKKLDAFKDVDNVNIHFLDEVEYSKRGYDSEIGNTLGCFTGENIYLRVPSHYSDTEEWAIFHTLVHELVHYVSKRGGIPSDKLNECITELVTYVIMQGHINKNKTHLKGQRPKDLTQMGYASYIIIVKQVLSKVPMEYFVDAMLNTDGIDALKAKFEEAFDDPDALWNYADNLNDAYMSAKDRASKKQKRQEKQDRDRAMDQIRHQENAPVIDLDSRRS